MQRPRPRVALIVETSTAYGRKILEGISKFVSTHERWSLFVDERELNAPPPDWLLDWDGDGIICRSTTPELAQQLRRRKISVVDLNDRFGNLGLPHVESDMRALGVLAAQHLVDCGFGQIAFCGYQDEKWSESRLEGLRSAAVPCATFESPLLNLREGDWDHDQSELREWVRSLPKPVGIVACNDVRALHVLDACESLGLIVPGEVSVVGIDNSETFCSLCNPSLSSVVPNASAVGYEAAAMLDMILSGHRPRSESVLIAPKGIVVRQSSDSVAVSDRLVAESLRFIREHLREKIDVANVATFAKVSRSTLERRFSSAVGQTPHEVIARARLARALKLLSETTWPLSRVADEVGYSHAEYLITVVEKATGQSPSTYRVTKKRS